MAITQSQQQQILAALASNRYAIPPVAMAGLGHAPFVLIPSSWGGMDNTGVGTPQAFTTTPAKVTFLDETFPPFATTGLFPEGVLHDTVNSSLLFLSKGVFLVALSILGTIQAGADFAFELYRNGVATGLGVFANSSNQTTSFNASIAALVTVQAGDEITLFGRANANETFTPQTSGLHFSRVR